MQNKGAIIFSIVSRRKNVNNFKTKFPPIERQCKAIRTSCEIKLQTSSSCLIGLFLKNFYSMGSNHLVLYQKKHYGTIKAAVCCN